jgi:F0F1-type ATP synthase assembly protein I
LNFLTGDPGYLLDIKEKSLIPIFFLCLSQFPEATNSPKFQAVIEGRAAQKMVFDFKKNRAWAENLQIVTQLGLTMAGCIAFCFFIGLYLDKWLGTKGVFLTTFIILGVIGGGVTVYRQILEITEDEKNEK